MEENILEALNIGHKFNKKKSFLFKNINLDVKSGETIALLGVSGRGKSTLAKILSGYIKPFAGSVLFNKKALPIGSYLPVQYVFQNPELAVNPRWKAEKILNENGLVKPQVLINLKIEKSILNRYPSELSGGELQRLAIARVLNNKSKVLILDELSAMLDSITQAIIWETLKEFQKINNTALIVISHDKALLKRLNPLRSYNL